MQHVMCTTMSMCPELNAVRAEEQTQPNKSKIIWAVVGLESNKYDLNNGNKSWYLEHYLATTKKSSGTVCSPSIHPKTLMWNEINNDFVQ